MDRDPTHHFRDTELKAAITRNLGRETAPATLRQRIRQSLQDAAEPSPTSAPPRPERPWLRPVAAAAILLIGLGALGYQLWEMYRPMPQFQAVTLQLEPELAAAMIQTHRACAAAAEHHNLTNVSSEDFTAMTVHLTEALKRPAVAKPLEGWTFRGADICKVGEVQAAHLVFTRGDAVVSLLSLPAPGYGETDGASYEMKTNGHVIAGYARADALICLVGSPSAALGMKELKRLRDEVQTHDLATCGLE